ncbi:DUF1801 domain-containing protein [Chengkuizengella sp. SCS-71B]|uniref:DUF1801 domain-containing protein n=1 Tax=Chengkuizengella sp. SCS-71B TaxID=3115290 RepID=UPI0032C223F1
MYKLENPEVAEVFNKYPETMRQKLMFLRKLVLDTASDLEEVNNIEETLKWGEPSYLTKSGSTIRMNLKKSNSDQYAMYFVCTTNLVETFRELYGESFKFEGNRAIIFDKNDEVPINELKHCISLALTYHRRKHLPMLGVL